MTTLHLLMNDGSDLTKKWINILDMVRDPIWNPVRANGGFDLTKDWSNIPSTMSFMN